MCKLKKTFKYLALVLLTISSISIWGTQEALAKGQYDMGESADKWVGKSTTPVEKAIAAGKKLLPKTLYTWGGGHSDVLATSNEPAGLDCSGFTNWMYRKGAGVEIASDYTTPSVANLDKVKKYYEVTTDSSKFRRGDLLICNGGGHIVTVLGVTDKKDVIIIGSNGGGNFDTQINGKGTDSKGGVSIMSAGGMKNWVGVIHMDKLIEAGSYTKYKDTIKVDATGTGTAGGDGTTSSGDEKIITGDGGDLSEDKIPGMPTKRNYDDGVPKEEAKALSGDAASQLFDWVDEYNGSRKVEWISFFRMIIMVIGRLFIVYAIFLILVYHYDLVKVHEGSLFNIATFGKLEVSYDGTSTYRDKNASPRLVNKSNLAVIVIILLSVAGLIISGVGYDIIGLLIKFVQSSVDFIKGMYVEING